MSRQTFEDFANFSGSRIATRPDIETACEVIESLQCRDLLTMLTIASQIRASAISPEEIVEGNRFHEQSQISQRLFHTIDGIIMDQLEGVDFVELSPLQPFGLNTALAGTNAKNVISSLKRSEVNADATTSLFRSAILGLNSQDSCRLATNTRVVRAQKFDPKTRFLPHFKVFAQVTVGKKGQEYGQREIETLIEHLGSEISIFDKFSVHDGFDINDIRISIGSMVLTKDLIERGLLDRDDLRGNTINPEYNAFSAAGLDMPDKLALDTDNIEGVLKDLGFTKGVRLVRDFQQTIEATRPELTPRLILDLGRIAGLGYYQHMCYKIMAANSEGLSLPLADGGTVNWAVKTTQDKRLFCVTTGIGTELLAQYFTNQSSIAK